MYGYDYGYEYNAVNAAATGVLGALKGVLIFTSLFGIFMIVCMWKLFKKAGKQGWESIIPVYNIIVLFQIGGLPTWYIVLMFIPFANIYAMIKLYIEIAKKFGKDTTFGILSLFFPFVCFPILAFGSAQYNGAEAIAAGSNVGAAPVQNSVSAEQPVAPINNIPVEQTQPTNGFNVSPNNFSGTVEGMNSVYTPQVETPVEQAPSVPTVEPAPVVSEPVVQANPEVTPAVVSEPAPVENVAPVMDQAPVASEPVAPVATNKFCPNCGQTLDANAAFCPNCGTKC